MPEIITGIYICDAPDGFNFVVMESACTWFVRMQSLADLYDPDFTPINLRKAHRQLDKVTDAAFGAKKPYTNNDEQLRILFDRYVGMMK